MNGALAILGLAILFAGLFYAFVIGMTWLCEALGTPVRDEDFTQL